MDFVYLSIVKNEKQTKMKKTFTVPQVPGSKRKSERTYTHAIIGRYNHDEMIKSSDVLTKTDKSNFRYAEICANAKPGDQYPGEFNFTIEERMIENGKAILSRMSSADGFRVERVNNAKEAKNKALQRGGGEIPFEVLRWSQSFLNASKGLGAFEMYFDVQIVEVKQI